MSLSGHIAHYHNRLAYDHKGAVHGYSHRVIHTCLNGYMHIEMAYDDCVNDIGSKNNDKAK